MGDSAASVVHRKPFDIQEAVMLLDVYLLEKRKKISRAAAAQIASERLRELSVHRGMKVSASFRSPEGLQNRLRSIGCLYEGIESHSAPGTAVFREAVDLYKHDMKRFKDILRETI